MSERTVGTCSNCRGPVTVPAMWGGIQPPTPSCNRCGATPSAPHGPIIPMEKSKPRDVMCDKDPAIVADLSTQTLYIFGEDSIEVDFVKVDDVPESSPFSRAGLHSHKVEQEGE